MREQGCYDVDTNQQATFDRAVERMLDSDMTLQIDDANKIALSMVRSNIPTASQAANAIAAMRNGPTFCYLAFYGLDGIASYMKVGVSRHPERRMYDMGTGNPLDCLWVFCVRCASSKQAFATEKKLLRHLADHKRRGEWVEVGKTDRESATGLARQLTETAAIPGAEFIYQGDRHGH